MTGKEINQLIIGTIGNLLSIAFLIHKSSTGNDKAIAFIIFLYPVIIVANAIIWVAFKSRVFKWLTFALPALWLPVLSIGYSMAF
jgi:hypothetical protein